MAVLRGQGGRRILLQDLENMNSLETRKRLEKESVGPPRACNLHEDTNSLYFLKIESLWGVYLFYVCECLLALYVPAPMWHP